LIGGETVSFDPIMVPADSGNNIPTVILVTVCATILGNSGDLLGDRGDLGD